MPYDYTTIMGDQVTTHTYSLLHLGVCKRVMSWPDVLLVLPDMADFLGGVAESVPLSFGKGYSTMRRRGRS